MDDIRTNATNRTANVGLPLFVSTDRPAWLVDWNNTMSRLDEIINGISDLQSTDHEDLSDALIELETAVTNITRLMEDVGANTSDISDNADEIEEIKTRLQTITSDLNTQNGLYQALETRVSALENN